MAIEQKRGDSLSYLGMIPATYVDGYFSDWVLSAMIRSFPYYTLIDNLIVEWVDPTTAREFTVTKIDTTAWPVGTAVMDIQLTRPDGFVRSTDTVQIEIVHDVTYPDPVV